MTPPSDLATITSANAPTIASAVVGSALNTENLSSFANFAPANSTSTKPTARAFAKLAEAQQAHAGRLKQQGQGGVSQAAIHEETNCAASGTLTVSGDVATTTTLTVGDTLTAAYTDCDQGGGAVVNGTLTLTITAFEDLGGGMVLFGVDLTVAEFEVSAGSQSATLDGGIALEIDSRVPPATSIVISTPSLTVASGQSMHTLSDYRLVQVIDASAPDYSLNLSGTLSSTAFDGEVDFSTAVDLRGTGDTYAFTGEVLITGADGATIRVSPLDNVNVRLETDLDGDGTADETLDVTWDELALGA